MIKLDTKLEGADTIRATWRKARTELLFRWERTINRMLFRAVRIIQTKYRGASETTRTATRQGSGALRGSYTHEVTRGIRDVIGDLGLLRGGAQGMALIYGAIHELGGTITAPPGKMLAIPLPTIRSPSGTAPSPREFQNTFIISKGPFGSGGIIARRISGDVIESLFALRKRVTIPQRPPGGAINLAFKEIQPALDRELLDDAVRVLAA